MALQDQIVSSIIGSIPNYVWIGLLLIIIGVALAFVPILPRKYAAISFLTGIIIIVGLSFFNHLWSSSENFRIGFVSSLFFIAIVFVLVAGDRQSEY